MDKVLGDKEIPRVCFLPWVGEFGWYIMNHVKRVHGYKSPYKIACIKKGHECLFPTVNEFFYNWADIPPSKKAGVSKNPRKAALKTKLREKYNNVIFADPQDTSWAEKKSLAKFKFIPKPSGRHDFKVDVAIAPRRRKVDPLRNYKHWQRLVDRLTKRGYSVAACGTKTESFELEGLSARSWDYTDVDTDVEIFNSAKIVISQDSGLAYLAMLCGRPIIILGPCQKDVIELHRNEEAFIRYIRTQEGPHRAFDKIMELINENNCNFPGS
jgi:ADP-heptose:LPS heptosyltransferase